MLVLEASEDQFSVLYTAIPIACGFIVPTSFEKAQTKIQSVLGHWCGLFMLCASGHKTKNLKHFKNCLIGCSLVSFKFRISSLTEFTFQWNLSSIQGLGKSATEN